MSSYEDVERLIDEALKRPGLTPDEILALTIARRLNRGSDSMVAQALGGAGEGKPPLNFWGRR